VATTADFKNGLVLKVDNKLQQIIEFQHVKPGKGPAFVRTKLKDVVSGKVVDKTFNAGVKVETATVDRRDMTYLYNDGTNYVFMDAKTYEQLELEPHLVGDGAKFLLDGSVVQVSFHEEEPLFVELPVSVELRVEHTDPGLQGDRSTGGTKPDAPQTPGGGDVPQAAGPSAKGPDGVSVSSGADDPGVTIVLDKVTRRGGLLFGEFVVSGNDQKLKFLPSYFRDSAGFGLNNARGELGGVSSIVAASGVTLISGGNYVFPVDYLPVGADSHRPLADLNLVALSEDGRSARICMAWPDTGEKTVIVDRPADSKYTPVPWRLTDVPVVEG